MEGKISKTEMNDSKMSRYIIAILALIFCAFSLEVYA